MKQTGHIQTGLFHFQVLFIVFKKTILKGPLLGIIELSCVPWTNFDSKNPNSFQTVNGVLQNCPQESFNWKEFVLHIYTGSECKKSC